MYIYCSYVNEEVWEESILAYLHERLRVLIGSPESRLEIEVGSAGSLCRSGPRVNH